MHLSVGAQLRDQDTGNKSYILVLGHTSRPRHRQHIVHLSVVAPLRDQGTGNKTYIFVLGHHFEDTGKKKHILVLGRQFETKTPATNRAFW